MDRLQAVIRWLSLAIISSLLLQALPAASPAVRAAQTTQYKPAPSKPVSGSTQAPSIGTLLIAFEQALEHLEGTTDRTATASAMLTIEQAWADLSASARHVRTDIALQYSHSSDAATTHPTQNALLAEYDRQFNALEQHYRRFVRDVQRDPAAAQTAATTLLTAIRTAQMLAAPTPLSLDTLPHVPVDEVAPITRVASIDPALQAAIRDASGRSARQAAPPVPQDLLPTDDAPITAEIRALASELNFSPLRIYQYVHNSIAYEPYYGSRKGALLTLWERSGNDVDTASLLIALLRASGVHARYVQGTVAIDATRVQNWVGNAPDLQTAATIFAKGGVPVTISDDGYVIKPHVWVATLPVYRSFLPLTAGGRAASRTSDHAPTSAAQPATIVPTWIELDASVKQFDYRKPMDLMATTGFDARQWIDELRTATIVDDELRTIYTLPRVPASADPENDDADQTFAGVKVDDAMTRTTAYLQANPHLTNVDLLGGAYIRPETRGTLPTTLPFTILPNTPVEELRELPAMLRDYVTIKLLGADDVAVIDYRASLPSLANRRITVAYEAATPADQEVIDRNGGTLLSTPPTINLVPVLRIDGEERGRGVAVRMAARQTRSITLESAAGRSSTVENVVRAGETFAVGLAYGRTSAAAIEASQQRLALARAALPTDAQGDPDPSAPGTMAEPVVGAMLHLTLQAYFNQLDTVNELVARGRDIRWFRQLSVGIASQTLAFDCFFVCIRTTGGGMVLDVQRNALAVTSLRNQANDERAFFLTTGHFGSALENSVFEDAGHGAVSTIRLHELALERNIPIHRIDQTNKADVFPLLQLNPSIEATIAQAVDDGKIVTVSQNDLTIGDWSGVGWIVTDPRTGAFGYLISGGLNGIVDTMHGGAVWETLRTVAAYALLGLNLGLDLWGIWAGISLLLVPSPVTIGLGLVLITANLVALGFDIADLMDLISGDRSASQYLGEQLTGLIIEAILKRVGIGAAAEIVRRLGPEAISRVIRQLDKLTEGAIGRLLRGCASVALVVAIAPPSVEPHALCPGLTPDEIINYSVRVGGVQNWKTLADLSALVTSRNIPGFSGGDAIRAVLNNNLMNGSPGRIQRIARTLLDAPRVDANGVPLPGYDVLLRGAPGGIGGTFQFHRAIEYRAAGQVVTGYEVVAGNVSFKPFVGFDTATRTPRFASTAITQELSGDVVLQGTKDIFVEAKWQAPSPTKARLWNQIQKALADLSSASPRIQEYRIESPFPLDPAYQAYIDTLPAAIKTRIIINDNLGDPFIP